MERPNRIVSDDEWLKSRVEFLKKEKEFNKLRDELSRERQALPFRRLEKEYTFTGESGKLNIEDLFCGKSQLIAYHFMFGDEWKEGCPSCSFWADNFEGICCHLRARDTQLVFVAHAKYEKVAEYQKRMGWKELAFVSSAGSEFNFDFHVSFSKEEMKAGKKHYNYNPENTFPSDEGPGISVFYKDKEGVVYHTYSTFSRGLDMLNGAYHLLDLVPKGRDEKGMPYGMMWLRHHDRYEKEEKGVCKCRCNK